MASTENTVLSPSLFMGAVVRELFTKYTVVAFTLGGSLTHYAGPRPTSTRITLVLQDNLLTCDAHPLGALTLVIGSMTLANAHLTASLIDAATSVTAPFERPGGMR